MTEEEYFRKTYPDSCYGDKPLSPHWDFFQDGVEFGERQSEKRIAELEATNKRISDECHKLVDSLEKKQKENAELKTDYEVLSCSVGDFDELQNKLEEEQRKNNGLSDNLTNAKEIIKKISGFIQTFGCGPSTDRLVAEAQQFLKESE